MPRCVIRAIMRFGHCDETMASRIENEMDIDFSECSEGEFEAAVLSAAAYVRVELDGEPY